MQVVGFAPWKPGTAPRFLPPLIAPPTHAVLPSPTAPSAPQDWNYLAGRCLEVTIEVSDRKWPLPAPERLAGLWADNEAPLLHFATEALFGGACGGQNPEARRDLQPPRLTEIS
jgi:hypothetical protein